MFVSARDRVAIGSRERTRQAYLTINVPFIDGWYTQ
jgi:hypothetical protein